MGHILSKSSDKTIVVTEPTKEVTEPVKEKPEQMSKGITMADSTQIFDNQTSILSDREFHTNKDSTYWLPKDDEEQLRLAGQHFAFKELFEGNVLTSIKDKLDFEKGIRILDVGCGAGQWVMDMVSEYPNCTYDGCDIVNVINENFKPPQFCYSYGNVLEGLDYEDNTFDFVHIRCLILAIREDEWPKVIKEAIRVTKPGGMIMFVEIDLRMTGGDNYYVQKLMQGMQDACKLRGQNPHIVHDIPGLIDAEENAKVVQVDHRSVDLASNTSVAKKFIWDWKEGMKSAMSKLGPMIGLHTDEEQHNFIVNLPHAMANSDSHTYMCGIAAVKTH